MVENGVILRNTEIWDDLQESSIQIYEAPIEDSGRRRLARIIASPEQIAEVTSRFHFGK